MLQLRMIAVFGSRFADVRVEVRLYQEQQNRW
jgi:hypothetical protein